MNAKEVNRESGRIYRTLLLPSRAERSQEDQEDYGVDFEIEYAMPRDLVEHMVEEGHAGRQLRLAAAVEIQGNADLRFLGIAGHLRLARHAVRFRLTI